MYRCVFVYKYIAIKIGMASYQPHTFCNGRKEASMEWHGENSNGHIKEKMH